MGRVARYKKVKASVKAQAGSLYVDSNRNRKKKKSYKERKNKSTSAASDFFDTAPSQGDDFDLSDPTLSVKKTAPKTNNNTKKKNNKFDYDDDLETLGGITHILPPGHSAHFQDDPTVSIPKSEKEEAKVARILKTDMRNFEKNKNKLNNKSQTISSSSSGTAKGNNTKNIENSLNKANRFYQESLQAMKKVNTSTHRHEKRKEYLQDKKKLSKKQKQHKKHTYEDDDYLPATTNNKSRQESSNSSGYDPDTAERPPIFPSLPKYATKKKHSNNPIIGGSNSKEMESLREKVQSQYQAMKLKRRKKGEFHL